MLKDRSTFRLGPSALLFLPPSPNIFLSATSGPYVSSGRISRPRPRTIREWVLGIFFFQRPILFFGVTGFERIRPSGFPSVLHMKSITISILVVADAFFSFSFRGSYSIAFSLGVRYLRFFSLPYPFLSLIRIIIWTAIVFSTAKT